MRQRAFHRAPHPSSSARASHDRTRHTLEDRSPRSDRIRHPADTASRDLGPACRPAEQKDSSCPDLHSERITDASHRPSNSSAKVLTRRRASNASCPRRERRSGNLHLMAPATHNQTAYGVRESAARGFRLNNAKTRLRSLLSEGIRCRYTVLKIGIRVAELLKEVSRCL